MTSLGRNAYLALLAGTLGLVACSSALVAMHVTRPEASPVPWIFYLHLPAAINTFGAAFVVFVAGIGYFGSRRRCWEDLAIAAGQVAVLQGSIVLLSGMLWARIAWGAWWLWSPRLTFSLILWLLYVVNLALRPLIANPARRAVVGAIYGIVAFLDVPLVYLSVKLLPDIHPSSVDLTPEMRWVLLVCLITMTAVSASLVKVLVECARRGSMRQSGPIPAERRECSVPAPLRTIGSAR